MLNLSRLTCIFVLFTASALSQMGVVLDSFRRINSANGLPSDIIYGVIQDGDGYMWIGSQAGLTRHDGYDFRVFEHRPNDDSTLGDSNAGVLCLDRDGNLWIGTWGGGLDEFDLKEEVIRHHRFKAEDPGAVSSDRIQSLTADQNDRTIWIGTFDGGLNAFDLDSRTITRHLAGDERIWTIRQDKSGHLWLGSDDGLISFEPETGEYELIEISGPTQPTPTVMSVLVDDRGVLCGTMGGIKIYDPVTRTFEDMDFGCPEQAHLNVRQIFKDSHGATWLATYGQGLYRLDADGSYVAYRSRTRDHRSLSHDRVECLFEDRGGILWIGTSGGGLNLFNLNAKPFSHVFHDPELENTLVHNDVSCFTKDKEGALWVGTFGGGVSIFKDQKWHHDVSSVTNPRSLSDNTVRALACDREGDVYVATYRGGLNRKRPGAEGYDRFLLDPTNPTGPSSNTMRSLMVDSRNRLWIGTDRGVDLMEQTEGVFRHINTQTNPFGGPGIAHQRILTVVEGLNGEVWVGTENGLSKLSAEGATLANYFAEGTAGTLSHDRVFSILVDRDQRIWFGTSYGLNRYVPETDSFESFLNVSEKLESVSNQFLTILEDSNRQMWLGTPAGLYRYSRDGSFRGFDVEDGLQSQTFNLNAVLEFDEHTFLFGGTNGFNIFDPTKVVDHPYDPPVVVTRVDVRQETRLEPLTNASIHRLEIGWHEREVVVHFASLDYGLPSRNRYATMLKGYQDEWVQVGAQTSASFMNLGAGDYTFMVKGTNRDGKWSHKIGELHLKIIPPFWQTTWFIFLCFLGLSAIVGWRIWDVRHYTSMLETTVHERTQSLEQANDELRRSADELREAQERLVLAAHQAGMAEIATGVLHNIGNLLNSVNVSSQELEKCLNTSKLASLKRVNDLIREESGSLVECVSKHPKGEAIMRFYMQLEKVLEEENHKLGEEVAQLTSKVNLMGEVIATQQSYAKTPQFTESVDLRRLFDDALKLEQAALDRDHVTVVKEYSDIPNCLLPRVKLMQMFTNLIKNAREAMIKLERGKRLRVGISHEEEVVVVTIEDNGVGIGEDKQEMIFNYGYSTKQGGHGFGLHATAIAMGEIGGSISVSSDEGRGSVFRLEFPLTNE
ncbi:MAG: GHKL domain-containing protein [Acidobacteria bacterium]|nr:GHKL domain-containing protein [Acidobacteriota bacterium]